ncbi:hypothetical protein FBUS_07307 [Fasciolopsis buskii]|uniref:Transmembrane protein 231 n=1 Tax=Fasciolopsis buskii TaxID=27845 RepID=A0A8E0VJ71_9TREM|nr:hypothetical protein FBUS_07307 [Fasciolopsis buski]
MWSTFPELNAEAITHSLRIPYMTVTEVDKDGDGRLDQMNLQLRFLDQINVTSIYLVLFYELKLSDYATLATRSPITIRSYAPINFSGNRFALTSDMLLTLSKPLVQGRNNEELNVSF